MIVTADTFDKILEIIKRRDTLSLDTETSGLRAYNGDRLFSIAIATPDTYYFNFSHNSDIPDHYVLPMEWIKKFNEVLHDKVIFMHNAKFDMSFLVKEGVTAFGKVHDTKTHERLKYNAYTKYSLEACGERIGVLKDHKVEKYIAKNKLFTMVKNYAGRNIKLLHYDRVPFDLISSYAEQDAFLTYKLGREQIKIIVSESQKAHAEGKHTLIEVSELERNLTPVLFEMERIGVLIDRDYCLNALAYYTDVIKDLKQEYLVNFGKKFVDSNKFLRSEFPNLSLARTPKGGVSFPSRLLTKQKSRKAQMICQMRAAKASLNFYQNFLYSMGSDNAVHTTFLADGTATGRFSSANPNLQNLTRVKEDAAPEEFQVRRAFVPRPDYIFVMMDYSQAEYRMMMDLAGATTLIEKVNSGLDVHQATADIAKITRSQAKTTNFAVLYGSGLVTLADQLDTYKENARLIRDSIFNASPEIKSFIMRNTGEAAMSPHKVFNPYGRISVFPNGEKSYKATNYIIQGGCADMIKTAMVRIFEYLKGKKSYMLLTIHDELVFEIHKTETSIIPDLKKIMIEAWVPRNGLSMDVDVEWSDKSLADGQSLDSLTY